ncbi:carbohydrate esterase family 4 protein [Crassisporium funariophilum]|nr:carbohydrate esterase family 4 protein [Crassisporium funariophilum]
MPFLQHFDRLGRFPLIGSTAFYIVLSLLSRSVATSLPERGVGAQVIYQCSVPNTVALTFDDGPYIYLNDVVDALKSEGVQGTFFFNGNNYACIYDDASVARVKYAYDNGMQVGSHTWAHKNLTYLPRDQVTSEMARTEQAIEKITGAIPAYTRPPYDAYNDLVLSVAGSRGQTLVIWDFDSRDSELASVSAQEQSYDDLARRHPNNILSLEHETYETSAHQVIPYAIRSLKAAGYRLVTLAECLNASPYLHVGPPSGKDASWQC